MDALISAVVLLGVTVVCSGNPDRVRLSVIALTIVLVMVDVIFGGASVLMIGNGQCPFGDVLYQIYNGRAKSK